MHNKNGKSVSQIDFSGWFLPNSFSSIGSERPRYFSYSTIHEDTYFYSESKSWWFTYFDYVSYEEFDSSFS